MVPLWLPPGPRLGPRVGASGVNEGTGQRAWLLHRGLLLLNNVHLLLPSPQLRQEDVLILYLANAQKQKGNKTHPLFFYH